MTYLLFLGLADGIGELVEGIPHLRRRDRGRCVLKGLYWRVHRQLQECHVLIDFFVPPRAVFPMFCSCCSTIAKTEYQSIADVVLIEQILYEKRRPIAETGDAERTTWDCDLPWCRSPS